VSAPQGTETFERTLHFEQDRYAATSLFTDPEASYWLWEYMLAGSGPRSFTFRTDGISRSAGDVVMTVRLRGATDTDANPDHHALISVNGQLVDDVMWDGLSAEEMTLTLDADLLADGANSLEIEGRLDTGAPYSIFYLDSFDVTYRSLYHAYENRLQFSAAGNSAILVSGFTRPDIMVFDITDPVAPVFIEASSSAVTGSYGVAIAPSAPTNVYIAVTPDAVVRASRIKPDTPSTLKSTTNRGEYVVITTRELKDTAQRLAQLHPDLSSQVIDIEDIWDEFNYGIASPKALRAFLDFAWRNWAQPPRYVVLAGDGTYDYKDIQGLGGNLVPVMMTNTPFGMSASDTWFANLDPATKAPEVAIGRLPAITANELGVIIDKIAQRAQNTGSPWTRSVMMLADNPDIAGSFPTDSNAIAALAPPGTPIVKVYLSELSPAMARDRLIAGINLGTGIVSYIGHAGYQNLAAEEVLQPQDLGLLTNGTRPTVMTAMTCIVGNYSVPGYPCLSELMVRQQSAGAAAVWSPTGLSQNELAVTLARGFYTAAFGSGNPRIGDAILAASRAYEASGGAPYMLDIYVLLGDPAMRLY